MGTPLARAQTRNTIRLRRIAGQVKTAQTLDCDDLPKLQTAHRFGHRIPGQGAHTVRLEKAQMRAARWTSVGLSMETPVSRMTVLGLATRTLLESGHAGTCPVIGERPGDRVARATMGAIDEGITPAAVIGIEQLGETRRAHRHVRAYSRGHRALHTGQNHKTLARQVGRNDLRFNHIHPGKGRRLRGKALGEGVKHRLTTVDLDFHTPAVVAHPPGETKMRGKAIHKGPKTHPLHHATNPQTSGDSGWIDKHQHGLLTLRPGSRLPKLPSREHLRNTHASASTAASRRSPDPTPAPGP